MSHQVRESWEKLEMASDPSMTSNSTQCANQNRPLVFDQSSMRHFGLLAPTTRIKRGKLQDQGSFPVDSLKM